MELLNKCSDCENSILWDRVTNHLAQADTYRTIIITTTVTIVIGLFTFAVSYGELRSQVKTLSDQINKVERATPYSGKAVYANQEGTKR
jgi:hypothetical protein